MQTRTDYAKRNIKWALLQRLIFVLCPFLIRALLIQKFSSEYLGLSGLCTSILSVLNMAEMGFSSAVLFCLYKPVADNDIKQISALMKFFRDIYKCIGLGVFIIGTIVAYFLPHLINGNIPSDVNIYVVFFLFLSNTCASYLLWGYKSTLLLAHQRNDVESKIITFSYLTQYLLQLSAIIIFVNYYFYVSALLISTICANLVRKIIAEKLYPSLRCIGSVSKEQKQFIGKKVFGAFIQKICGITRTSLGPIVVSSLLGLSLLAIYDNYLFIITSIKGTLDVIIVAITTSIGDSIAKESSSKNYNDLRKFTFIYSLIGGFCTIVLLNVIQPFMQLWMGAELMFKPETVFLLCLYFYVLTIGDVRSAYIVGAGLWWEGRYRSIAETVVNILLICILGHMYGVNGIIIGTILSVLLINFFWGNSILFDYYFKGESQKLFYCDTGKYFLVTITICVVLYYLISSMQFHNVFLNIIVNGVISVGLTILFYFLIYRKSRYFHELFKLLKK